MRSNLVFGKGEGNGILFETSKMDTHQLDRECNRAPRLEESQFI